MKNCRVRRKSLNKHIHDRNSFDCGNDELNLYLKDQANQNQKANIAKVFAAVDNDIDSSIHLKQIYGYYSLSAGHISFEYLPDEFKARIPKYPIPIARIGRLAVNKTQQGKGVGAFLLYDAFKRVLSHANGIGIYGVVVDAKPSAIQFYVNYGFQPLKEDASTLILPLKIIKDAAI